MKEKQKNIFNKLLNEHGHILRMLNLLELQFLDLCRGRAPDYAIMLSIIVYIQEYPEQAHHPLEDAIFSILLERVDEVELKLIQELITDHTQLEVVTRKLRASLESLKSGTVSKEELKQQLPGFIVRQRQHIYNEEITVYPLMQSILTKKDWLHIQSIAPLLEDPVFGDRTRNDYELLYREIEGKNR